ncbi:homeobox protein Hox-A3 isoform X2 [Anguilla rostrata]|uniref:homeobox protein Hox-A3 isoform X2 n=1 Tax=Anguilla rostrata TaxID=7938 RepID=UPI0030CC39D9
MFTEFIAVEYFLCQDQNSPRCTEAYRLPRAQRRTTIPLVTVNHERGLQICQSPWIHLMPWQSLRPLPRSVTETEERERAEGGLQETESGLETHLKIGCGNDGPYLRDAFIFPLQVSVCEANMAVKCQLGRFAKKKTGEEDSDGGSGGFGVSALSRMNPARSVKRGAEGRPAQCPGFGTSGKSFLIDNLLGTRGPPPEPPGPGNPPPRASSPPRTGGPAGGEWRAGVGSQQGTPKHWRSVHAKGFIPQSYTGFPTLSSRPPPAFLTFCGGSGPFPAPPAAFPKGSSLALWPPDSGPRSRKGILRRAVFSEEQRKELERTFRKQKYIGKADRNKLAADLRLKESQVKIWFQNQRMKWRNSKEKEVLCGRPSAEELSPVSDLRRGEEAQERSPLSKVGETARDTLRTKPWHEPHSCEQLKKPHDSSHQAFTQRYSKMDTARELNTGNKESLFLHVRSTHLH